MACHCKSCHVMVFPSGCLTSCHVMSCHVLSCHVMSCHVMSCHVMSSHGMSCHVMSCHLMACHVMSCHVVSCRVVSCCVMSCPWQESLTRVVSRWVRLLASRVGPCPVVSCHVASCFVVDKSRVPVGFVFSRAVWAHVLSRHVMSWCVLSYRAVLCFEVELRVVDKSRGQESCPVGSSSRVMCGVMSCRVMSCHVISRRAISCPSHDILTRVVDSWCFKCIRFVPSILRSRPIVRVVSCHTVSCHVASCLVVS